MPHVTASNAKGSPEDDDDGNRSPFSPINSTQAVALYCSPLFFFMLLPKLSDQIR
jgi:hypothetical protein